MASRIPKKLETLLNKCSDHIDAIYHLPIYKGKGKQRKLIKREWRITSSSISPYSHFIRKGKDKGKHRFSKETLHEALVEFFKYLRKCRKV